MKVTNRYKQNRKETQEQIKLLIGDLDLDARYVPILDLIAKNYDLMYMSLDDINQHGLSTADDRNRFTKNTAVQSFTSSQTTLIKLLSNFPSSPLNKAKIKKIESNDSEDEVSELDEFMK